MKTIKNLLTLMAFTMLLVACGTTSDKDKLVGYENYTFNTTEDIQLPITQDSSFTLLESVGVARDASYTIENSTDLEAFNSTLTASEQLTFNDLDTTTYFLLRLPGCENYYKLTAWSYSANVATITLAHFVDPDVVCFLVLTESYMVFKAQKAS